MRSRFLLFFLLAGLIPWSARGENTKFFIERIEVRNLHHVSASIILAESRLQEGHAYSETEMHDAANRVQRLPFVVACDLALEKGSERGRYVLVLKVTETRLWFFQLGGAVFEGGGKNEAIQGGHRWFFGQSTESYLAAGTGFNGFGDVNLGINRYDLFGRGGLLNVNLEKKTDSRFDLSPSLTLTVPTVGNQALRFNASHFSYSYDFGPLDCCPGASPLALRNRATAAGLSWIYDSTDDPFLPVEGIVASATIGFAHSSQPFLISRGIPSQWTAERVTLNQSSLEIGAARHRPLFTQGSFETGVDVSAVRSDYGRLAGSGGLNSYLGGTAYAESVRIGYSDSFWSPERSQTDGYFRWQVFSEYHRSDSRFDSQSIELGAGLVFRNGWGLITIRAAFEPWTDRETIPYTPIPDSGSSGLPGWPR
ncbi:MAG: hypothetical protein WBX15_17350 [Thermoanaerobaculia bacterium]